MLRLEHISTIAEEEKMIPIHIGLKNILKNGKKIQDATGEKLSTFYLLQSISMAIQRGNAICVTTCVKDQSSGLEGLFNFQVHEV